MAQHRPILIVDDDPMIRSSVSAILLSEGYPVETAANGAEALVMVVREKPSLVVLDMRMPVMDGWRFAQALAAEAIKVPIVVMTAARNAEVWADEISAQGYLAKPFDLDDLLDRVEQHRAPPPG